MKASEVISEGWYWHRWEFEGKFEEWAIVYVSCCPPLMGTWEIDGIRGNNGYSSDWKLDEFIGPLSPPPA